MYDADNSGKIDKEEMSNVMKVYDQEKRRKETENAN